MVMVHPILALSAAMSALITLFGVLEICFPAQMQPLVV
jgi:hypothetical protein